MILALLLFAADAAAPRPGPITSFGDWAVACDNVHACEMTSLVPEDDSGDATDGDVSFSIRRTAGPSAGFVIGIDSNATLDGAVSLRVDDRIVVGGTMRKETLTLRGPDAAAVVGAIVGGARLTLTDGAGKPVGSASLTGSSAALRFIDADQGRAGGVTAAVARGAKPAGAVPAAAPLPRVRAVAGAGSATPVTPALIAAMRALSGCEAEDVATRDVIEGAALGVGKTLVLLPCGSGAYNFSAVPFVVVGGKPVLAAFDHPPGWTDAGGPPTLVNAAWSADTGRLQSFAKGRGLGDCGSSETYVWDGATFRLIEARVMNECRGSINWLTIWRAQPVPR